MPSKVFVSYSSRDRLAALRIKEIAEADGHHVWLDQFDIRPGAALTGELRDNVIAADVLCLLLTPAAAASPWVLEEIRFALSAESGPVRILPVLLQATEIPDELADVVAVDAGRGLADDAVVLRVRRALGGDVPDGAILDATRRAELADRAAADAAEERWPQLRARLARVIDDPIRELQVTVDQDTWPDSERSVLEIVLDIDIFLGSLHLLLAPYVEGHTWRPGSGLDERPPDDFLGRTEPRVDGRLLWAGRTVVADRTLDATDLGETPLKLPFRLAGDEYTGDERRATMALLERFELPSLRHLVDSRSTVTVWRHPREAGEPERVDPDRSGLRLRLEVPLRVDDTGLYGFRLWSTHDRDDTVLLRSPTPAGCSTAVEREALLSLHRNTGLRAAQNALERRRRLTEAVARTAPVPEEDRWAAFTLAVRRADVPRSRGAHRQAAELVQDALDYLPSPIDPATLSYNRAFLVIGALMALVDDVMTFGGNREAVAYYGNWVTELARGLCAAQPGEPDFARVLSMLVMDRDESIAILDGLVAADPLPWRLAEARRARAEP
ncbi:toll/interleukin-1 receptor domain-containing protein [Actinoplanes sp. M2I2]|uniref:toll/interleukin-1 receptor domain-containing protein n=1 Tax=Actinoplanes sp. M2I2 TaxID=1734444 RepID=UPI00201FCA45|nr:toll/interleukin-1 receptor domain-containing protein [Actinoplanes sp. M2I2]